MLLLREQNGQISGLEDILFFPIFQARYKQSLDPTVDEVKKLCTSLRRNAKEERVLFHYNGHGVPRPTVNGEIWVFNKVWHAHKQEICSHSQHSIDLLHQGFSEDLIIFCKMSQVSFTQASVMMWLMK